jgi:hypothetical protein
MALIRLILLIILFYFAIRLAFRFFLAFNQSRRFKTGNDDRFSSHRPDGEVTVNVNPSGKEKKISKEEGEYVKFEEIKGEDKEQ